MISKRKGFTLIELLVVISIISLLSSIVFSALGNARSKAKDAAIKQEVGELQKVIEQSFLNGNYKDYSETKLWVNFVEKDCSNLEGNMANEAKEICKAIYNTGVGDFVGGTTDPNRFKFAIGVTEYTKNPAWGNGHVRYDLYSITVKLNSGNIYCVSNLGTYEGTDQWAITTSHPPCLYWLTP